MRKALGLSFLLAFSAQAQQGQPNIEAGKAKVAEVCAACHGANGVSVSDTIPNLAGQRRLYIESQLKALKDGSRKNPIMNAIAAQLSSRGHRQRRRLFRVAAGRCRLRRSRTSCRISQRLA